MLAMLHGITISHYLQRIVGLDKNILLHCIDIFFNILHITTGSSIYTIQKNGLFFEKNEQESFVKR
jgi:hypothetical protein